MDREIKKAIEDLESVRKSIEEWNKLNDSRMFTHQVRIGASIQRIQEFITSDRQRIVGLVRELKIRFDNVFESRLPIQEELETLIREILQEEK